MTLLITCRTPGCINAGTTVELVVDEAPGSVVCGPCGLTVPDVREATP